MEGQEYMVIINLSYKGGIIITLETKNERTDFSDSLAENGVKILFGGMSMKRIFLLFPLLTALGLAVYGNSLGRGYASGRNDSRSGNSGRK